MTVVCIAGMHRSGTSMVARMLNLCGVYLGDENDLMAKDEYNPEGYWENINFVNINDSILDCLKAGWDFIPLSLPLGWENDFIIDPYKKKAAMLAKEMSNFNPWGWKDPRNSLTLPFWRKVIPEMKVVVCLRNPIEVSASLLKRGASSKVFSAKLWYGYYEKLVSSLGSDNFIITHYDSYFYDCESELRRLLNFLGMEPEEENIIAAASSMKPYLKKNKDQWKDLSDLKNFPEVIEMYGSLCSQAGPVFQLSFIDEEIDTKQKPLNKTIEIMGNHLRSKDEVIAYVEQQLAQVKFETGQEIADLKNKLQKYTATSNELKALKLHNENLKINFQKHIDSIAKREQLIESLKKEIEVVQSERDTMEDKLQEHKDWITNRDNLIGELEWQIKCIHNSVSWKILYPFIFLSNYLKEKLFTAGKKRTRLKNNGIKAYRVLRDEGIMSALRNTYQASKIVFRRKHKVELVDLEKEKKNTLGCRLKSQNNAYVPIAEEDLDPQLAEVKPIAIYLPQFHPIPENDEWWGKGFTEWTNVSKALPNFHGHYQPRIPDELGYYDLRIIDVQKRQVQLAKKYGIYGFCFYYYWFDGKRLLERPVNQYLENPDIDFPFCFCWANENWTRCWDGEENDVLIGQNYSKEGDKRFIHDIIPAFRDKRYIRVDGKPLLVIYRVNLLPDPKKTAEIWRSECKKNGIGDIYLAVAQSFGISDPRPYGFDGAIEFPMHHLGDSEIDQNVLQITNPEFNGRVFDYRIAAQMMMQKPKPNYPLFKTVVPSWDNTARRQNEGHIFVNSSPEEYKKWLDNIVQFTKKNHIENNRFVFINAWNEWAEGNYLEPDSRYGYAYLEATAKAVAPRQKWASETSDWTILFVSHDAELGGAQVVLLNQLEWFKKHTTLCIKVLCLHGGKLLARFKKMADTMVLSSSQKQVMEVNPDELTGLLLDFCNGTPDLIYGNTVAAGQSYHWLSKLGVPILTHFHELEMSIKEYGNPWVDMILNHSSHFLACSRPVNNNLIKNYGIKEKDISVVHSSVPSDNFPCNLEETEKKRIKKQLGLVQDKLIVFGCGIGMPFRKGADLFIETARILMQKGRDDFHFYWVGGFEKNFKDKKYGIWSDCLKQLHNSKLDSYVTFLGKKENPKAYFQAGDIFLLPSREDPFPLVALEAADCGLPTICFENVGTVDLVEKDAGFIVPLEDVEDMTQRLINLMDDEDLRKRMGAKAQEKFRNNFTVERTTPHILTVCRNVANQKPGVSVIVPNFNHEQYLPQRLDSIFNQTYKDFEVILLDDASEDKSLDVLKRYVNRGDVKIVTNKNNSASPFKQWLKGFDIAKSDIWWVAESDDECDPDFLKSLVPAFKDQTVRMVYANSSIIDEDGNIKGDYLNTEYLTALSRTKWKTSYKVSSEQEINDALGVKNTILNVSAVLFKRIEIDDKIRNTLEEMSIAGDWYFIVNAIKGGKVQYDCRKLNSHRRHTESVIGKLIANKKVDNFYREMAIVHKAVITEYKISKDFCAKWEQFHQDQWKGFFGYRPFDELKEYYPFEEIGGKINSLSS